MFKGNIFHFTIKMIVLHIDLSNNIDLNFLQIIACKILHECITFVRKTSQKLHINLTAVVTPTDRPKSVRNRCVIRVFGDVFVDIGLLLVNKKSPSQNVI